jgi:hypothetical protein
MLRNIHRKLASQRGDNSPQSPSSTSGRSSPPSIDPEPSPFLGFYQPEQPNEQFNVDFEHHGQHSYWAQPEPQHIDQTIRIGFTDLVLLPPSNPLPRRPPRNQPLPQPSETSGESLLSSLQLRQSKLRALKQKLLEERRKIARQSAGFARTLGTRNPTHSGSLFGQKDGSQFDPDGEYEEDDGVLMGEWDAYHADSLVYSGQHQHIERCALQQQ